MRPKSDYIDNGELFDPPRPRRHVQKPRRGHRPKASLDFTRSFELDPPRNPENAGRPVHGLRDDPEDTGAGVVFAVLALAVLLGGGFGVGKATVDVAVHDLKETIRERDPVGENK